MKHLQKIIKVYSEKNIPFAVFRYPKEELNVIAQYSNDFIIEAIDISKEGFLIHPFVKGEKTTKTPETPKTPIAFIKPDIFTKDFESINLLKVPFLKSNHQFNYNETLIDFEAYKKNLEEYLNLMKVNGLRKIIASRIVNLPILKIDSLAEKLEILCVQNPNAFCYLFNLPGIGLWLGATPEILLEYQNEIAKTVALAGTKKLEKNIDWGTKEIEEQAFVGNYIKNICRELDLKISNKSEIETITAGNIQHLKTTFLIDVEQAKLNQLINALHPTPAVAGLPKQKAIQYILKTESYDRQYYTGFLGMIRKDKLQLYVNLRCAKLTGKNTLAFVGGGITKDSDIKSEWKETLAKSETIESILTSNQLIKTT